MRLPIRWIHSAVACAAGLILAHCDSSAPAPAEQPTAREPAATSTPQEPQEEAAAAVAVPAAEPTARAEAAEKAAPEEKDETAERLKPPTDLAKPTADAVKIKGGITYKVLRAGSGDARPEADDSIWLHYSAWEPSGAVVDSTFKRRSPKITRTKKLTEGWRQVVEGMAEGELRRAWIPEKLAYTPSERKKGRSGQLVIDFELLKLSKAPPAPEDVAKPPKDAKLTVSGLAYKVLQPGKEDRRPDRETEVTVKYSGWRTDGECFDFTPEGETSSFKLDGVIGGWTEGLQLMTPGQKNRFWIPENLAYKGKEGKPAGMLVFDVELIDF